MSWGTPNWRDAGAYPQMSDLSLREWWWQFTRRREDYRALWETWAPVNEARISRSRDMYERLCAQQGDTLDIFLDRAPTDDPDELRVRYRMSTLLNPRKSFADTTLMYHLYRVAGSIVRNDLSEAYDQARELLAEGEAGASMLDTLRSIAERREGLERAAGIVHYLFELSKPLGPQLEEARGFLDAVQSELFGKQNSKRPKRSDWTLYLRALDARDQGATYAEMAADFWPDDFRSFNEVQKTEQSARDTYKQALRLRDNFPI